MKPVSEKNENKAQNRGEYFKYIPELRQAIQQQLNMYEADSNLPKVIHWWTFQAAASLPAV